jgi:hypothetical protein
MKSKEIVERDLRAGEYLRRMERRNQERKLNKKIAFWGNVVIITVAMAAIFASILLTGG